jgi:tetratricopeptide (TPR) repeat protein
LYLHEFHYPEIAKQYLDTAINLKKGYIQAYYQRGAAYFQLQQYWNAMQDISQSFAQQPNSPGKDSIVMQINKTADSVNTMMKYCTDMINNSVNTQKYYEERSVLLQMLGDSIRAENDRRKKREF